MKLIEIVKNNVRTRKFIVGVIVFLVTLILCIIMFQNWDAIKTLIFRN